MCTVRYKQYNVSARQLHGYMNKCLYSITLVVHKDAAITRTHHWTPTQSAETTMENIRAGTNTTSTTSTAPHEGETVHYITVNKYLVHTTQHYTVVVQQTLCCNKIASNDTLTQPDGNQPTHMPTLSQPALQIVHRYITQTAKVARLFSQIACVRNHHWSYHSSRVGYLS